MNGIRRWKIGLKSLLLARRYNLLMAPEAEKSVSRFNKSLLSLVRQNNLIDELQVRYDQAQNGVRTSLFNLVGETILNPIL